MWQRTQPTVQVLFGLEVQKIHMPFHQLGRGLMEKVGIIIIGLPVIKFY